MQYSEEENNKLNNFLLEMHKYSNKLMFHGAVIIIVLGIIEISLIWGGLLEWLIQ